MKAGGVGPGGGGTPPPQPRAPSLNRSLPGGPKPSDLGGAPVPPWSGCLIQPGFGWGGLGPLGSQSEFMAEGLRGTDGHSISSAVSNLNLGHRIIRKTHNGE